MMNKRLNYYLLILNLTLILSCADPIPNKVELPKNEVVSTDLIEGKWNLDSSLFINNGRYSKATPPVMPTTWFFGKNGIYKVQNSLEMPGTYTRSYDSLFVILMGVANDYEIVTLTESFLTLHTTILENDSVSVITEAFLSRKN